MLDIIIEFMILKDIEGITINDNRGKEFK